MEPKQFEKLVEQALNRLPEKIRKKMDNVAITVEKRPNFVQLKKSGLRFQGLLLGLYQGVPQTRRGPGYSGVLPDKITIFQESIENLAQNPSQIVSLVRDVVWHEVAHHFGFNEREIRLLEQRKKSIRPPKG